VTTADLSEARLVRVGHRGARRLAAANTLLGFEVADGGVMAGRNQ
jgi:hypothetical protein